MSTLKERWNEQGYFGPITVRPRDEMKELSSRIVKCATAPIPNPVYEDAAKADGVPNRDAFLYSQAIFDLASSPAIIDALKEVMGPNILLWRSTFFEKKPASGVAQPGKAKGQDKASALRASVASIPWHQGKDFAGVGSRRAKQAALNSRSHNVTVWVSLWPDPTAENGALELVEGSHLEMDICMRRVGRGEGVFLTDAVMDYTPPPEAIRTMEMSAGQAVGFHSFCVHGSGPNRTQQSRYGIAFRYVPTAVQVYGFYPELTVDEWTKASIENHRCILVSGTDDYQHNRLGQPPDGTWDSQALESPGAPL